MKRNTRRLALAKTTLVQLDAQQLRAAAGGYVETGCVGGCNSAFPCFDYAKKG